MFDKAFMITFGIIAALGALTVLEREAPLFASAIAEIIGIALVALVIRHWILPIFGI